jgi:hypothetical protein
MDMRGFAVAGMVAAAVLATAGFADADVTAAPGDRIECASVLGGETRVGEVAATGGEGGTEPFLVQWDDGTRSVVEDADNCFVLPAEAPAEPAPAAEAPAEPAAEPAPADAPAPVGGA